MVDIEKFCDSFAIEASPEVIKKGILDHLKHTLARDVTTATKRDWWLATCYAVRDRILTRFITTQRIHHEQNARRVYYLSLEYLMGRLLTNNLSNTGLLDITKKALTDLGLTYDSIRTEEVDMGLGNGGLGRLAACFLDSLATLDYPAIGYGIHYEFGLFRQEIVNCQQEEHPDNWLQFGNPWQIMRPENALHVKLYGRVEDRFDDRGDWTPHWVDTRTIMGVPWDIPIVGYGAETVNFLRLWESRASEEFDFQIFNEGGYVEAVHEKAVGETISKVLYPNDKTESGKELRLVQQYFFISCSLQDILRRFFQSNSNWDELPNKAVMQLNDTHPAIAIAELMRLLIDQAHLPWEKAWAITNKTFAYTNHTLMPEALEKWSVPLLEKVLPRHLQIIYEINRRFLEEVEAKWPGDGECKQRMSIVEEGNPKLVRMAYLAVVGSFSVNGVAKLHTQLLKDNLLADFYQLYGAKFNNKTNGITPRRWLRACNPHLTKLIDSKIGKDWTFDLEKLRALEPLADDPGFKNEFRSVKHGNKAFLARIIASKCNGLVVSPDALFDVQIKRLHEYKRQHLNLLHILTLYRRLLHDPSYDIHPRVFIFGAKAAPGYDCAKDIIYGINVAGVHINNDKRIRDKLKVAFIPNYNVGLATAIIPAADLSEQISTAGKEASGTGNMKLALNGACTIGTLDGANIEILEEVGNENIFIFGATVDEINQLKHNGYNPFDYYHANSELKAVLDWMGSDFFAMHGTNPLKTIRDSFLSGGDPYFCLADYGRYIAAQMEVDKAYKDKDRWSKMAILNVARMGKFSSDRTIREYAKDIWHIEPLHIPMGE